ncbi:MAG: glycosyltransferase, partial [Candidatus Microsaccharimonas sp.]
MKTTDLKGKRFLITQSSLRVIAGSEINTLEIADYLQSCGAVVTVYTYFFSEPISTYFHEKGINVVTDETKLDMKSFDYVWVH